MSLSSGDYDDLFTNIGEFVQRVNDFTTLYAALDTDLSEIIADLEATSMQRIEEGLTSTFDGFKGSLQSWCSAMVTKVTELLTDKETVIDKLPLGGNTSLSNLLRELYRDMDGTTTVQKVSSISVGTITKDTENTGANVGTLMVTTVLDGASSPGGGRLSIPEYVGNDSELIISEATAVICVADHDTNGLTEGNETFQVVGLPVRSPNHWEDEGSGTSAQFGTLNTYTYLDNLQFEDFTNNAPDSWTIDSGAAASAIFEESSTVYRGSKCLKFVGDTTATIQISQTFTSTELVPLKRYCLACWVLGDASVAAGALTIELESPSGAITAGSSYGESGTPAKISMDAAALAAATSWSPKYFFVNMPKEIPTDLELVIKVTGTLTTSAVVRVDAMAFGPVVWHNGMGFAVAAGQEDLLKGDRFTFTPTVTSEGVFQKFFRRNYGIQLPSAASPGQADSKAT